MTTDGDADSSRGSVPSKRAVQRTPHGVHPSKELRMNAHVSNEGRVPAVGRRDQGGQPPSRNPKAPAKAASARWLIAGLLVLSAIPLINGAVRLTQLAGGAEVTPANARFFASPMPVVLHIVSATLYALLGAFQFVPSLRRRRHGWHRTAGWIVLPSGLIAALSGLWMTLFYRMPAHDGALVYGLRLLFGSGMLLSLLGGVVALRRREFLQHGNWMLRAYAIGMGAGTQVLTGMVAAAFAEPPTELSRALLMGAAWVINLTIAEWAIR